jgi:hypothetical protein
MAAAKKTLNHIENGEDIATAVARGEIKYGIAAPCLEANVRRMLRGKKAEIRQLRNEKIELLRKAGVPVRKISKVLGCHRNTITGQLGPPKQTTSRDHLNIIKNRSKSKLQPLRK